MSRRRLSKFVEHLPLLIFSVAAGWHAALAVTAITALMHGVVIRGEWVGDFARFAVGQTMWTIACIYVANLILTNGRLRKTPAWEAASDAYRRGLSAGIRIAITTKEKR